MSMGVQRFHSGTYKLKAMTKPVEGEHNFDPKHALKLAGKLAQSVDMCLHSTLSNLSTRITDMEAHLNRYNDYILKHVK